MKVQFIENDSGVAEYVVLPVDEYRRLAKLDSSHSVPTFPVDTDDDDWQEIEYDSDENDNVTIPHEVVAVMVDKQCSLLSAWRQHRGLTQSQVAETTDISQANLSQMEKQGKTPQSKTLEKLATVYGCEPEQLID